MERSIFRFILRHSAKDQAWLVFLSAAALPFLYLSFELPKRIVNEAIGGHDFPKPLLGMPLEQVPYLLTLCAGFLALVLINGAFKFFTSTYRYRVGDRLLRRLRYDLIERLLRFPVRQFRSQSSGQIVSMVAAETSPLGFFMSEALTVPTVAAGTLGTIVLFIFLQDWMMGLAAIALYPLQIIVIPKIQQRVNDLQRRESLAVRGVSDRVGHLIAGAAEIHGNDTSQYELAQVTKRLGGIFDLRVRIASSRYVVNVLNQFFSQLTPFFFLSIGGYLAIRGDISLGSLVAVLSAHKDMYAPWKDLIDYYQKAEDARVKYEQLQEYFEPPGLMDRDVLTTDAITADHRLNSLTAINVVVESEDGIKSVDGASLELSLPVHAGFHGGSGAAREELARLFARQLAPRDGELNLDGRSLPSLPDSLIGRQIAFAGAETFLGTGSIRDALTYPLRRRPIVDPNVKDREALLTGNNPFEPDVEWVDHRAAGCATVDDLRRRIAAVLGVVGMVDEVYAFGLRRTVDERHASLIDRVLMARHRLHERVVAAGLGTVVESFDRDRYLTNATVAENILFGTPIGDALLPERLGDEPYMRAVLDATGLTEEFLERGRKLAALMTEMFRSLKSGQQFFEQFSFIKADELPEYELIVRRSEQIGLEALTDHDRARLLRLPFKLVAAQHTIGQIDEGFQKRLLAARNRFAGDLPAHLQSAVQFFDRDTYNRTSSIYDNLLFGKVVAARKEEVERLDAEVSEVLDELDLRLAVIDLGLDYDIGIGGTRLTAAQRQRLALARCLIKNPEVLILNDAWSALDGRSQQAVFEALRAEMHGRTLLLIEADSARPGALERSFELINGKVVEQAASGTAPALPGAAGAATAGTSSATSSDDKTDQLGKTVGVLAQIPLFAGMDRAQLKLLAFTSEPVTFDAGHVVFRQGDTGDNAYVILDGDAEVVLETGGDGTVIARLGRYQVFGEMALLTSSPRSTTIRAGSTLSMLAIRQDVFVRLVEENAAIAVGITRMLIDRLAKTNADLNRARAASLG